MALGHWAVEYLGEGNGQGGSGGGALIVNMTKGTDPVGIDAEYTDKTAAEIKAAMEAGLTVVFNFVAWEEWGINAGVAYAQSFVREDNYYHVRINNDDIRGNGNILENHNDLSGPMYFIVGE